MKPDFWHEAWRTGHIGFHQPRVESFLETYWPSLGVTAGAPVFVPLCGKSLDMVWLQNVGHAVTGVEISAAALETFCLENGIPARRRSSPPFELYETAQLRLFCGDFFSLTPALVGPVAAIYDRAALVSWAPEMRERYVEQLTRLTHTGTQMLIVTFEYRQAEMKGPPFSVSADDIDGLFAGNFAIIELARRESLSKEPRMQARGLTQLHEACYQLTRF